MGCIIPPRCSNEEDLAGDGKSIKTKYQFLSDHSDKLHSGHSERPVKRNKEKPEEVEETP
jgi:hypothetical protein